MKKEIISFSICQKLAELKNRVDYYQKEYFPELKESTGKSQYDFLESAKKDLEDFHTAVKEYNISGHEVYLGFSESEKMNYLRRYAIDEREKANDFSENPYIKIPALKNCILALQELKKHLPELEIYSNHWLSSKNKITIHKTM